MNDNVKELTKTDLESIVLDMQDAWDPYVVEYNNCYIVIQSGPIKCKKVKLNGSHIDCCYVTSDSNSIYLWDLSVEFKNTLYNKMVDRLST